MPCKAGPGDIAGLILEGTGSPAGSVIVIGQAFRAGDLPSRARVAARTADGRPLPAQIDVSARHPDGSARFGQVSLQLPAMAVGQRLAVILAASEAGRADAPLEWAQVLEGRQAQLQLTSPASGRSWQFDLLAALRSPAQGSGRPWQSGPLAIQQRVTAEVPPDVLGGVTSMRIVADIAARADGTLWYDVWLRNDVAMRPGGGTARYTARIMLDGRQAFSAEIPRHWQYQGWGRLIGVARDGRPAPAAPFLRPNAEYLADTGAIARYDLSLGVGEAPLAGMAQAVAEPAWAEPLGNRQITKQMPAAGARPDIGPTTLCQAAWLISGDPRAAAFSLGQAEAAGSVPWHTWDSRGGWMDERRWPGFWYDVRNGPPPRSLLQPFSDQAGSGWVPETAHQPSLSFVPYLLTGRRAFLDELQAQAAWNVLSVWPETRRTQGAAHGVNIITIREVRSAAWSMREVEHAAWISPDDDPQKAYFRDVATRNWAWLRAETSALTAAQGEAHGWLPPVDYGGSGQIGPWQQDYFATTVASAARRGNADARAVLAWMANFLVGRFRSGPHGLSRNDGAAVYILVRPPGERPAPFFRTWAEIGNATRAQQRDNGSGWRFSDGEYGRLGLESLALVYDVLGLEAAKETFVALLSTDPPPHTSPAEYARVPINSFAVRGLPRVPGRVPACVRAVGR